MNKKKQLSCNGLQEKKNMKKNNIARALIVWFLTSLGVFFTGFLTGFYAHNLVVAVIATAGLGLINALLWPVLSRLALARSVITFALSALIVNGAIIGLLSFFTSEIKVSWSALFFLSLNIAIINTVVSGILTIDDDASFYRAVSKKMKGRAKKAAENKDKPGFIFLEIDGLAEKILRKGSLRMHPGTAHVVFHPPIDPAGFTNREDLTQAVRQAIASGLPPWMRT